MVPRYIDSISIDRWQDRYIVLSNIDTVHILKFQTIFPSVHCRMLTATNDPDLGLGPLKGDGWWLASLVFGSV